MWKLQQGMEKKAGEMRRGYPSRSQDGRRIGKDYKTPISNLISWEGSPTFGVLSGQGDSKRSLLGEFLQKDVPQLTTPFVLGAMESGAFRWEKPILIRCGRWGWVMGKILEPQSLKFQQPMVVVGARTRASKWQSIRIKSQRPTNHEWRMVCIRCTASHILGGIVHIMFPKLGDSPNWHSLLPKKRMNERKFLGKYGPQCRCFTCKSASASPA